MDLAKEIETLQRNRAIGGVKHHHTVVVLFEEIKQILADIVFLYSAQAGLYKQSLFSLVSHIHLFYGKKIFYSSKSVKPLYSKMKPGSNLGICLFRSD